MEIETALVVELRTKYGIARTKTGEKIKFYFDGRRAMLGVSAPNVFLSEKRPVRDGDLTVKQTVIHFKRRETDPTVAVRWETQEGYDDAKRRIDAAKTASRQLIIPSIA